MFHTELRELFLAMHHRKDRIGLRKLLQENEAYRHLGEDTVEALAVMLNAPKIWEEREHYMEKNEEREEYNMCQALREWIEEERSAGREEGIKALVEICHELGAAKSLTVSKIMQKFSVKKEIAEEYVDRYWK